MKQFKKSLFIFRRDLRLEDNTSLIEALKNSDVVIPCFIFDAKQLDNNPYRGENCVQFMVESLTDLDEQLEKQGGRLYLFYGDTKEIVRTLIKEQAINAVYVNHDYTPFSIHRDLNIKHECETNRAVFKDFPDYLLNEPYEVLRDDGGIYSVYTPFKNKSMENEVRQPQENPFTNYFIQPVKPEVMTDIFAKVLPVENEHIHSHGGRTNGLKILEKIARHKNYDTERDIPSLTGTTGLSAHHKFGTLSIREVYHAVCKTLGKIHTLVKQLYWRDFFVHVGYHHPDVLGNAYYEKYNKIKWRQDENDFKAWCEGRTGFPIVDAGMRELNTTGFMHNRVRMVTASLLVKDLQIDWRWGEKYFAQKLIDYDPFVNNGNWQWVASTGCDVQPYFRVFNPWRQQEKFDPECKYIKKWIPELKQLSPTEIHQWSGGGGSLFAPDYPPPMVNHDQESAKIKEIFKKL
jgi:deoxyribodipyrimidine photo-lyase